MPQDSFKYYIHQKKKTITIAKNVPKLHLIWNQQPTKLQMYSILILTNFSQIKMLNLCDLEFVGKDKISSKKFLLDDSRVSVVASIILCCFFKCKKI